MKKRSATEFLWALCLLAIGAVLLLVNLNMITLEFKSIYLFVYPFILLIFGIYTLIRAFTDKIKGHLFWGLFFVSISGFLIADRFEILTFRFLDFWKLWPIILIYGAIKIFISESRNKAEEHNFGKFGLGGREFQFDDKHIRNAYAFGQEDKNKLDKEDIFKIIMDTIEDESTRNMVLSKLKQYFSNINNTHEMKVETKNRQNKDNPKSSFGKFNKDPGSTEVHFFGLSIGTIECKKTNWSLEHIKLKHTILDYYFDMSKAFIPEEETFVVLSGLVGQIRILIPEDIPVKLTAMNTLGNIEVFGQDMPNVGKGREYTFESTNYEEATRKINLALKISIGSIEIVKV